MGRFRRQDQAARAARKRAQAEQAASRAALARGGLPVNAQRRLDELRARGGSFTSDLSVDEFAAATHADVRPLAQVMGSSVYHVGSQRFPSRMLWPRKGISRELPGRTDAWNRVRGLALGRLAQEASLVGADAVVGVHVTSGDSDWAARALEFVAVGTAVRVDGMPPGGRPALTNLSGQDFW
jgi:uncharacterized protein YbjQ (UPF0145 family)